MFPRQTLFAEYAPRPLNDVAVPPFPALEADDEEESRVDSCDLDFELPEDEWRPIESAEAPSDVPVRFIDGSIVSRVTGDLLVDGRRRPLVAATISAACLDLEQGEMHRSAQRTVKALCLHRNGIRMEHIFEAESLLEPLGIRLFHSNAEQITDFDTMRRSTRSIAMSVMEDAEREVLRQGMTTPSLVDGLLERRIYEHQQGVPVVGLVKRQIKNYLPPALQELAYTLKCGERTPAFVMNLGRDINVVNSYIRLSDEPGTSPSYGIVRMTVPLEYFNQRGSKQDGFAYLSGLAGFIYRLRHRDFAYDRAGISIEPIVRVEEDLHALRPDIEDVVWQLSRLLR